MKNPVRIVPLLLIAVVLMGARCTKEEIDTLINNVAGTSPAPQAAALYVAPPSAVEPSSSSEEVVTVAVVVEPEVVPEPEPLVAYEICDPYLYRGEIVPNCHWEWR